MFIMPDEAREQVARELRNACVLRVFLALHDYLSWTAFRPLNQANLASRLKISNGSVSRSLKDMHTRGMIERAGKGPVTQWRFSLKWGWGGDVLAYRQAVREAAAMENKPRKRQPSLQLVGAGAASNDKPQ